MCCKDIIGFSVQYVSISNRHSDQTVNTDGVYRFKHFNFLVDYWFQTNL